MLMASCGVLSGVSSIVVDSERVESEGDRRGGTESESVSSVVGSSQGGQMVCCCGVDAETNAAATELCVGVLLHLANCLAALSNAAAWRGLASLVLGSVACLVSGVLLQSLSQCSPLPGSLGQKRQGRSRFLSHGRSGVKGVCLLRGG